MKIERLEMKHWGHFEQFVLELAGAAGRFHVVLGDNEAGKSTTRRAISALLYGVPRGGKESFRFDQDKKKTKLALGATLTWADATSVTFTRVKTNDAVLGADGKPVSIPRLAELAHQVPLDQFELEYSLDQAQLRAGGRALLEGKGEAGQGLLAAGMGGFNVKRALGVLADKADALFVSGGKARVVNELLSKLDEKEKEAAAARVDPAVVQRLRAELGELQRELGELAGRERALLDEKAFLRNMATARPIIAELAELDARLRLLERSPKVSAHFAERRKTANARLADVQQALPALELQRSRLEGQLQGPQPDAEVLAREAEITVLSSGLSRYDQDVELVRSSKQALAEAAERVLVAARGVGVTVEQLLEIRRGALDLHQETVKGLQRRQQSVHDAVGRIQLELDEVTAQLEEARGAVAALPPEEDPRFIDQLQAFVSDAPDRVWRERADAVRKAASLAEEAFADVHAWTGTKDALLAAKLPTVSDCDDHDDELRVEVKLEDVRGKLETARGALEDARGAEAQLRSHGPLPTAEGVAVARDDRQRGWFLVRDTLEGRPPSEAAVAAWTGGQTLVAAYEGAVRKADGVSDELTRGSDRAAKLDAAKDKSREAERQVKALESQLERLEQQRAAALAEWAALWSAVGIAAGTPKAMRAWLAAATRAREATTAAQEQARVLEAFQRETLLRAESLATRLGLAVTDEASLAALREASRDRIAAVERLATRRKTANETVAGFVKKEKKLTGELKAAKVELEQWEREREALAGALGRAASTSVGVLEAIIQAAQRAQVAEARRDGAQRALEGASKGVDDFERQVKVLATALALPAAEVPVLVSQASQRLSGAKALRDEREARSRDLETVSTAFAERQRDSEAVQAELKALFDEAGTSVPTELERIEADNETRKDVSKRLDLANSKLAGVAAGVGGGVEALQQAVEERSEAVVEARRAEIDVALGAIAGRRSELNGKQAVDQKELDGFEARGDEAVRKEAECESLRAQLAEASREYLRLQYARQYIADAVERYRKEHQGPVLSRASEYFSRLTRGSFSELTVEQVDEKQPPRLQGVRVLEGEKEEVEVEEMSEGTRDELFLALRLAALDVAAGAGEPLPLIVDDTLVNLCDGRARVAMQLLFELSKKTQVLIFTHHASVAALAKEVAGAAMGLTKLPGDEERLGGERSGEEAA